ncbi:hypothetical protein BBF93_16415 [Hyphomonas sp. CACIAM 19H1]|nr:hypothetical protein BBF93_16415 [Hyphomonas sp. CACIAM 19H1]
MDKVRVGMWLWLYECLQQGRGGSPKFWIQNRIAQKDRLLVLRRYPKGANMRGLAFWGLAGYFIGLPSAFGLLANNIALISVSSEFFVARHIRTLNIKRVLGGDQEPDYFDVQLGGNSGPLFNLLSGATVFGQCIMPKDSFSEFGIPVVSESTAHKGLSEGEIVSLNNRLVESPVSSKIVPEFKGNVAANVTLMELDVIRAFQYLLADVLRAGTPRLLTPATTTMSNVAESQAEASMHELAIRYKYEQLTGLKFR